MTDIAATGAISRGGEARHMTVAIVGALLTFAVFVAVAMWMNDGVFEYPLDDVYIHLAMSEQIANGGYGVNAGEFASAASSPIYPIFLLPFVGEEVQRWLPLFWNVVALVASAALVGWALARAELGRAGLVMAFVTAFALNMYIVAYSGMENMAHGAASLAIVVGLWRFAETGRVGALLIFGVFLAPALRLEGLALALAAGGVVFLQGRPVAGLALGALAVLPVAVFVALLTSLGLDPLPNSVNAKLPVDASATEGFLAGIGSNIRVNATTYGGRYVIGLLVAVWVFAMMLLKQDDARTKGLIGLGVAAAAVAHLGFAATGWLDRYENYLVLALFAALTLMLTQVTARLRLGLLSLALAGGVATYIAQIDNRLAGMRAIHNQQGEMSRFAKDFVRAPIAVNDLGYVAWDNPDYVLDLFGLASQEALALRLGDAPDGWADPLADRHGVKVAMIYDSWVGPSLGPDWTWMGDLVLTNHGWAFLGSNYVSFYARDAAMAEALKPAIAEWERDLPEGSYFVLTRAPEQ
ncbi:MAG: hypothetical protein AAFR73_02265 [Pseudomonadota bacterium]